MRSYIIASLFIAIVSSAFALCDGGHVECPDEQRLIRDGDTPLWFCCNQTVMCGSHLGSSFDRYRHKAKYTIGTVTYHCVDGPNFDNYPTPCQQC